MATSTSLSSYAASEPIYVYKLRSTVTGLFWRPTRRPYWYKVGKTYSRESHAKTAKACHRLTDVELVTYETKEIACTKL